MMIFHMFTLPKFITDIGDKLTSFTQKYMDSPLMAFVVAVVLVVFGYWAISYFTKK